MLEKLTIGYEISIINETKILYKRCNTATYLGANHFSSNACTKKSSQNVIESRFDNFRIKPIIACGIMTDEDR